MDETWVVGDVVSKLVRPKAESEPNRGVHSPDVSRGLLSDMEVVVDGPVSSGTGVMGYNLSHSCCRLGGVEE